VLGRKEPKITKELLDIAIGAALTLVNAGTTVGSGRAAPMKTTIKSARKGAKGRKKGQKCQPCHLTTMASNNDTEEEINDSDEKFVAATKHDFMRCTRLP
jgi:hypothetical protein